MSEVTQEQIEAGVAAMEEAENTPFLNPTNAYLAEVAIRAALAMKAKEQPTTPASEDEVERVAEIVFEAMREAARKPEGGNPPAWVPGGNSIMQGVARDAARAAIAAMGDGRQ